MESSLSINSLSSLSMSSIILEDIEGTINHLMSCFTAMTVSCPHRHIVCLISVCGRQDQPSKWNIMSQTEVCLYIDWYQLILKVKHRILKKRKSDKNDFTKMPALRLQPNRGPQSIDSAKIIKKNRNLSNELQSVRWDLWWGFKLPF